MRPHLRGVFKFEGAFLQRLRERTAAVEQNLRRLLQLDGLRGIDDVVRGEAIVQPAGMLGYTGGRHFLSDRSRKGNHVVLGFALDGVDSLDIEGGMCTQSLGGFDRHFARLGERFGCGDLQPRAKRQNGSGPRKSCPFRAECSEESWFQRGNSYSNASGAGTFGFLGSHQVAEDIQNLAVWIFDEEPTDTPRFVGQRIDDFHAAGLRLPMELVDVGNLNTDIRQPALSVSSRTTDS